MVRAGAGPRCRPPAVSVNESFQVPEDCCIFFNSFFQGPFFNLEREIEAAERKNEKPVIIEGKTKLLPYHHHVLTPDTPRALPRVSPPNCP